MRNMGVVLASDGANWGDMAGLSNFSNPIAPGWACKGLADLGLQAGENLYRAFRDP